MFDLSIQAQILNLMTDLQRRNHTACIFISHDPEVMWIMSDRIGLLCEGAFILMDNAKFAERFMSIFGEEERAIFL